MLSFGAKCAYENWLELGNNAEWEALNDYETDWEYMDLIEELEKGTAPDIAKNMKAKRKEWAEKGWKKREDTIAVANQSEQETHESSSHESNNSELTELIERLLDELRGRSYRRTVADMTEDEFIECIAKGVREGLARNDLAHNRTAGYRGGDW